MKLSWFAVAIAAALSCVNVHAQVTWHVDNNAADDTTAGYAPPAGTRASQIKTVIQDAVDAAVDGDTVIVYPGTYTSTNSEVVNLLGKAITLQAAVVYDVNVAATWATVDGQDARRCIVATLNETNQTVVRGMRIWRGRASAGGGIYVVNGSPRIEDCWFLSNFATGGVASGGGLRFLNSTSMIQDCFFQGNVAGAEGGAIFNAGGAIMVSGCEFRGNTAPRGGGIFTREDAALVAGCQFLNTGVCVGNWSGLGIHALDSRVAVSGCQFQGLVLNCDGQGNRGAAIAVVGATAAVSVTSCEFVSNFAGGRGGAISLGWPDATGNRGSLRVAGCEFRGNSASIDGGAIAMQSYDSLEIDGFEVEPTVFESNSAGRHGGAISLNIDWTNTGSADLDNCLFTNNAAGGNGGAIGSWLLAGALWLDDLRFVNNAAGSAGGALFIRQDVAGAITRSLTDSIFLNNTAVNGGGLYLDGPYAPSLLGRNVYCGNDPNDVQGTYFETAPNCFTIVCIDADSNGFPDTCEIPITDCNSDGIADDEQLVNNDVNNDRIPDDCQTRYLDFAGLESELVPIQNAGSGGYPATTALCWRVYAKTINPTASVICVFGNSERTFSISAPGGLYQNGSGGDTVEGISCTKANPVLFDSYFTIEATCDQQIELQTTPSFPAFNTSGNFSTANGAYYVTPGAAGSQAGDDNRVLLMQLTTNQAIKPTTSINILGRHGVPDPNNQWFEWQAFGLQIPDPILVDCNNNGIHDAIEIATGQVADADRNGSPDNCQQCRGDVDLNGAVDVDDLIEVFIAWGNVISGPPVAGDADLNNDGIVNALDLVQVISGWGSCLAP